MEPNNYQKRSDDFGSFLSSVQTSIQRQKTTQDTPMRIMRSLAHTRNKAKVIEVMGSVRSSWTEFNDGLKYLEEAGFVRLDDDDDGGMIRLTKDGQHWAKTMSDWKDD